MVDEQEIMKIYKDSSATNIILCENSLESKHEILSIENYPGNGIY